MKRNSKLILGVTLAALVFGGAAMGLVVDIFTSLPDFNQLKDKVTVPIKLANGEKSTKEMGPKAPGWAPISQISSYLLSAVISSEDTTFYQHKGVDLHELREAIKRDLEEKRWARGASTITQQVLKNVYLGQQKTILRKVKEILWAGQLEKALTKSEILCFYVNMAEWGPGLYGIREAASHYFQKSPSQLTAKEAAFLTMLIPSPVRYHSYYVKKSLTPWAARRVGQILRVMHSMGFLEDEEYQAALVEPLWGKSIDIPTDEGDVPVAPPDSELPADGSDVPVATPTSATQLKGEKTFRPSTSPKISPSEDPVTAPPSTPDEGERSGDSNGDDE